MYRFQEYLPATVDVANDWQYPDSAFGNFWLLFNFVLIVSILASDVEDLCTAQTTRNQLNSWKGTPFDTHGPACDKVTTHPEKTKMLLEPKTLQARDTNTKRAAHGKGGMRKERYALCTAEMRAWPPLTYGVAHENKNKRGSQP